jgi:hypothetical protein
MIINKTDDQCTDGQRLSRRKMVQNIYSSRTYARIRRMTFVSLLKVSDLFNIMYDYSDGVWFREMMQLMLSIDTDSDDGVHDLIMR